MDQQYVGIDFHRRRSVIVRMTAAGERLAVVRVVNDPAAIMAVVADAGPEPEVVIEATYGWYWVVDLLQASVATVHLANPKALNWGERRVKNDVADGTNTPFLSFRVSICQRARRPPRPRAGCPQLTRTKPQPHRARTRGPVTRTAL